MLANLDVQMVIIQLVRANLGAICDDFSRPGIQELEGLHVSLFSH